MKKNKLIIFVLFLVIISLVTKAEEKEKTKKDLSKLLVKTAKLISNLNDIPKGKPAYRKLKNRIVRHFKRAVSLSEIEGQKGYFKYLKEIFKNDKAIFPDNSQVYLSDTDADIFLEFNAKKKKFFPVVLKTDKGAEEEARKLYSLIKGEIKKGILNKKVKFYKGNPVIKVSDVLFPKEFDKEIIILKPKNPEENVYPRIILIKNVINENFDDGIKPVTRKIFNKKFRNLVNSTTYMRNLFLHRISHFIVPFSPDNSDKAKVPFGEKLKELFLPVEEVRADLDFIIVVNELEKKGLVEKGMMREVVYTFVAQKIKTIASASESIENSPSVFLINYFLKEGGLKLSLKTVRFAVDEELLMRNIKKSGTMFTLFLGKGKYNDCKSLFQKYDKVSERIKEILKKLTD